MYSVHCTATYTMIVLFSLGPDRSVTQARNAKNCRLPGKVSMSGRKIWRTDHACSTNIYIVTVHQQYQGATKVMFNHKISTLNKSLFNPDWFNQIAINCLFVSSTSWIKLDQSSIFLDQYVGPKRVKGD